MKPITFVCSIWAFSLVFLSSATIMPPQKGKQKLKVEKKLQVNVGPVSKSVFERDLLGERPTAKEILVDGGTYYENTTARMFGGPTLGFVTPWNNHGYDVAKIFGAKFDMISPVWLQVISVGQANYEISGTHDVDANWIKAVRKAGPKNQLILPRVMFEKMGNADYTNIFQNDDLRAKIADLLVKTCQQYGFDGIVLEAWFQLAGRFDEADLTQLVVDLATALKSNGFRTVLVVPPMRGPEYNFFTARSFETLYPVMEAFSLVTYDFSNPQRPGANSPLSWARQAVENICPNTLENFALKRRKILIGMNMYGYDYTLAGGDSGPITANAYLKLLEKAEGRMIHDEHDEENFIEIKRPSRHIVFFPTLYSIQKRIELARQLNTGLALWELGQGLDSFYDLF